MTKMNRRSKYVSAGFMIIIALILNIDTLMHWDIHFYVSHIVHCIAEGVIVLMFSRELRGERWMA